MRKNSFFLLAITFFSINFAWASLTLDEVLNRIKNKNSQMENIRMDFKQEVEFYEMSQKSEVEGEMAFTRDGKVYFKKQIPTEQITISNGKKVWVYNPSFRQVWVGSAKNWLEGDFLPKGIVPLNNFVEDLNNNFVLSLVTSEPKISDVIVIHAEPKNKDLNYSIDLYFSSVSWLPTRTVYKSESARVDTFFTDPKVNAGVSDDLFNFETPKGTEIISLE
jgi:outer membrane lipoprotein carrier protein